MDLTLTIQNIIDNLTPWIVIVVVGILFWKVPVWKTRIEGRIENIEDRIKSIEVRLDKVEIRLDDLYKRLDDLNKRFGDLYKLIASSIDRSEIQSSSPLKLTDYGTTISEKVGADQIADHYAQQLLGSVESLNPYQVQEYCFKYCEINLMSDLKDECKQSYENIYSVAYEDGIELNKITRVIAIKLRDAIFSIQGTSQKYLGKHSSEQSILTLQN